MTVPPFVKDASYIGVGFGVIAFQKAQVKRQEIRRAVQSQVADTRHGIDRLTEGADDRFAMVEERLSALSGQLDDLYASVESSVDEVLEHVEVRLPEPARDLFHTARGVAKEASDSLRELVSSSR